MLIEQILVFSIFTSNSLPIFIDHKYASNTSCPPAAINSPLESIATQLNCTGRGDTNVLKLRYLQKILFSAKQKQNLIRKHFYLIKSKARTEPSREADTTNFLLGLKTTSVTELVCSENVTKQNPDSLFHNLT